MEEIDRLTKQVQMLKESVDMMLTRSEQLFKMQEERLNVLPQLADHQSQAIEELETTNEALLDSLNENDAALDEMKKAVAAVLLIAQMLKAASNQNANQNANNPAQI